MVAPRSYKVVTSKDNLKHNRQHLIPTQVDFSSEVTKKRHIPTPPMTEPLRFENSGNRVPCRQLGQADKYKACLSSALCYKLKVLV